MIRKLFSSLVIAFVAGCAGTAGEVESVGEGQEAISAVSASGDEVTTASCPTPFQCSKADIFCQDPIEDAYWCNILSQCFVCEYPEAQAEETAAVAPAEETAAVAVGGDTQSASCPTPFQCAKADMYCQDPETDVYWCNILSQCFVCQYPEAQAEETAAVAPAEETAAVAVGGDTQSAWCPTPFQCAKADMYCQDPIEDEYWCNMLGLCFDCQLPAAPVEQQQ